MNPMTKQFLENPDYVEATRLLLELHHLIAQGKIESVEADEIRDDSDTFWYRLSEAEKSRFRILSASLDMLLDAEVFRPVPPEQRTQAWLEPQLTQAQDAGDWDTVLALLRNGPDYMTPDELAYRRNVAYRNLGHCEAALLFADYAYRNGVMKRSQSAAALSQSLQTA